MLDSGCFGLAGNFGFEQGHYDVSGACAERVLLPTMRDADVRDVILADGFSCRTQVSQSPSDGRQAVHLAELLCAGQQGDDGEPFPERRWSGRPRPPSLAARAAAAGAVAVAGISAIAAGVAFIKRGGRAR